MAIKDGEERRTVSQICNNLVSILYNEFTLRLTRKKQIFVKLFVPPWLNAILAWTTLHSAS
jgi:hypothetical protein